MVQDTPLRAARRYCIECCNGSLKEVRLCTINTCGLFQFRLGKGRIKLKDIRKACHQCDREGASSIRRCEFDGRRDRLCPLHKYRLTRSQKMYAVRQENTS